jgi:hypothetical protein
MHEVELFHAYGGSRLSERWVYPVAVRSPINTMEKIDFYFGCE